MNTYNANRFHFGEDSVSNMATTSTLAAVESKKQAQEHKSAESKIPRLNKLAGFVTY